ncbi:MAG: ABC transporter permease, partial [Candidatus Marinimicrobia bacterium]|nr:ABC transporter permease [Candidatus Neomarinimicrobiota bacterium]
MKILFSRIKIFLKAFSSNRLAALGFVIVIVMLLTALLAPILAPYPPDKQIYQDARQSPSVQHIFGTDLLGRDILSRVIYGTRISLMVGFLSMAIAASFGITAGLLAGFFAV